MNFKAKRLLCLSLSALLLASCGVANNSSQPASTSSAATTSSVSSKEASSVESGSSENSSAPASESSTPVESSHAVSSVESSSPNDSKADTSAESSVNSSEEKVTSEVASSEEEASEASSVNLSEISSEELDGFVTTEDGAIIKSGNTYYITAAGSYVVEGEKEAQIVVQAGEDDVVEITLNGVTISNSEVAPIHVVSADKIEISAKNGTTNKVIDTRALKTEDVEDQGNGAIYAKTDLKLKGKGSLEVEGSYNNGVHTTKDLTVKNLTLKVTAPNNALKGNDSLVVESGNLTLISTGGDGMKTEHSDISSKGKQRGNVEIQGGNSVIYAACDGIDAAYDAVVSGGSVDIVTNKYSPYTGTIIESSTTEMYLRTTDSVSSSVRYSVYFYDDDGNYVWSDATFKSTISSGRTNYNYYSLEKPSQYGNFMVYCFSSSASNSTTDYLARSTGNTYNANYDTVTFSVSGSSVRISGWTNYNAQQQGGQGGKGGPGGGAGESGNTDKADVSAKGIKADNVITVSDGEVKIKAYDDGIHANSDVALENGNNGLGDVTISGGSLEIDSADDGVHADRYLKIEGGYLNVISSYEGIEGNQILISGGTSYVYASDDGVNAGSGSLTPLISVSGGFIFAAVPSSGDTDGFDSNGTITLTGGVTIACGPTSTFGMSAFDAERGCTMSGTDTTLILFGGAEASPSGFSKTTRSASFNKGTAYRINYADLEIETGKLLSSYSSCSSWSSHGSITSVTAI